MRNNGIEIERKGLVFNIQKFSLNDGPGIRTIVFLKGCPLSCDWCSNPESQNFHTEVLFNKENCTSCGKCSDVCPLYAIDFNLSERINRKVCTNCGLCAETCYSNALVVSGKDMTVMDVVKEIKKDDIHYRRSGGGITLSGGEPLSQASFSKELLKACRAMGWHTAIETTGYASDDVLLDILPLVDLVLLDIKTIISGLHEKHVGIPSDELIRKFLLISENAKEVIVRIPVIPGFNADKKSIELISEFVTYMKNVTEVHLLPYHKFGDNKYETLGKNSVMNKNLETPSKEEMLALKEIVESKSLICNIGAH